MDKKQTVFLSAILGIGSIMMLSFLIISATKANPACTVSDDLTVTGKTTLGDDSTDKVTIHGLIDALKSLVVAKDLYIRGDSELGYNSTNKVKAYQYCDENGNNCHDTSGGWGGGIPSGLCMFSDTVASCPTGWTRRTQFDGRTIKGASSPGGTGGSNTHTHDVNILYSSGGASGSGPKNYDPGPITSGSASSWPPYMEVIICCKN